MNYILDFKSTVESIYGVYLDSTTGFKLLKKYITDAQKRVSKEVKKSIIELDNLNFTYGKGDPSSENAVTLHKSTQGQIKKRNAEGNINYKFIGNMCLISIFNYWEDNYRKK